MITRVTALTRGTAIRLNTVGLVLRTHIEILRYGRRGTLWHKKNIGQRKILWQKNIMGQKK
jgi:hypothetical protein